MQDVPLKLEIKQDAGYTMPSPTTIALQGYDMQIEMTDFPEGKASVPVWTCTDGTCKTTLIPKESHYGLLEFKYRIKVSKLDKLEDSFESDYKTLAIWFYPRPVGSERATGLPLAKHLSKGDRNFKANEAASTSIHFFPLIRTEKPCGLNTRATHAADYTNAMGFEYTAMAYQHPYCAEPKRVYIDPIQSDAGDTTVPLPRFEGVLVRGSTWKKGDCVTRQKTSRFRYCGTLRCSL